jgi:anaerobic selenocysteine-containing dehydrogenase
LAKRKIENVAIFKMSNMVEIRMEKEVRTICQSCHCECGVLVRVKDGKILGVKGDPEHPMNRGYSCVKGRAIPELVYHPDRLKYPLKRSGRRGDGKWERISWNQALDGIAAGLSEAKERYGAESIAAIHGTGPRRSLSASLLPYALGSPNRISVDLHICFAPSLVAEGVTVGHSIMMEQGPDYNNANCIIVWGANPLESHPARGQEIVKAQKRGAKLIVVDPRKTPLAAKADLWLPIRPGTDDALALGIINHIIQNQLYDGEFVSKWCNGFDELKEGAKAYTPEKVSEITWLAPEKIIAAAEMYASIKPAALHHRVAIEHNINSAQTNRALIILVAITGNVDVKGGNLLPMKIDGYIPSIALAGAGPWLQPDLDVLKKRIGFNDYPLVSGATAVLPFVPSALALDAIVDGKPYPLKALYCAGANPPVNMQNSKKVWEALKKDNLDLFVVVDFFMTPSAELADYVLPAASWLERDECCDLSYMGYISARQKVIEPLYEAWDELQIIIELVKRIPGANRKCIPWDDVNACNEWMINGMGISFDDLKKRSFWGIDYKYRKYEKEGFHTPSGKVELYSTEFEKHGYDPIPDYKEPPESPLSTPDLMEAYPFILMSGGRTVGYFHSEGRQLPSLRKLVPEPLLEIHPESAEALNIADGDWVWLETPQIKGERTQFKVTTTPRIDPKMVHCPHGWWFPEKAEPHHGCFDSNPNVVMTGDPPRDKICASVPTRGTLCKIYKA